MQPNDPYSRARPETPGEFLDRNDSSVRPSAPLGLADVLQDAAAAGLIEALMERIQALETVSVAKSAEIAKLAARLKRQDARVDTLAAETEDTFAAIEYALDRGRTYIVRGKPSDPAAAAATGW